VNPAPYSMIDEATATGFSADVPLRATFLG
jgi:hypothetical protein